MQNIVNNNDNFGEQTNTLLYKNISHALFSIGWCFHCVREMSWRQGQTAILTPSSSDHSSISFSSWLGVAQLWVTEGPKPSFCCWFSIQHFVSNWLKPSVPWLYNCLMPTCFWCSSTYLHRCISWLTAQSRLNI